MMINLPNSITIFRGLLFIPLILFLIQNELSYFISAGVVIWLLDLMDGAVARKFHQVTEFGQHLDSATDKIIFLAIFITMGWIGLIPLWVFAVIAIAQALQLALVLVYFGQRKRPVTGMMFLAGVVLFGSLFVVGDVQRAFWLGAVLAAVNHTIYYAWPLFKPLFKKIRHPRQWIFIPWLRRHLEHKMQKRHASFHASHRILTWANGVTFLRLILGLLLLDELWSQHWGMAIVLGVVFGLLDFVDGHLARKFDAMSVFGKIFDVLVDKSIFLGIVIVLSIQGFFPVLVLELVLLRYAWVAILAILIYFGYKKPLPVSWWSMGANLAFLLILVIPGVWWLQIVILLQLQQMLQYGHDSYRLIK